MTENEIKQKVKSFCKKYKVSKFNCESLKAIIEKQGYTVIEYNQIVNNNDVSKIIQSLKLSDNILRSKGFTYADNSYRLVFINEDLSDDEKCIVLAHEVGHIYLNHLSNASIIGKDVKEEYEANEFAHFLLNPNKKAKISAFFKKHKTVFISCLIAFLLIVGGLITFSVIKTQKEYYGEYYVTSTGNKYHKRECIFVKNKDNIRRLTKEEFDSNEYEPCEMCLPNDKEEK